MGGQWCQTDTVRIRLHQAATCGHVIRCRSRRGRNDDAIANHACHFNIIDIEIKLYRVRRRSTINYHFIQHVEILKLEVNCFLKLVPTENLAISGASRPHINLKSEACVNAQLLRSYLSVVFSLLED